MKNAPGYKNIFGAIEKETRYIKLIEKLRLFKDILRLKSILVISFDAEGNPTNYNRNNIDETKALKAMTDIVVNTNKRNIALKKCKTMCKN